MNFLPTNFLTDPNQIQGGMNIASSSNSKKIGINFISFLSQNLQGTNASELTKQNGISDNEKSVLGVLFLYLLVLNENTRENISQTNNKNANSPKINMIANLLNKFKEDKDEKNSEISMLLNEILNIFQNSEFNINLELNKNFGKNQTFDLTNLPLKNNKILLKTLTNTGEKINRGLNKDLFQNINIKKLEKALNLIYYNILSNNKSVQDQVNFSENINANFKISEKLLKHILLNLDKQDFNKYIDELKNSINTNNVHSHKDFENIDEIINNITHNREVKEFFKNNFALDITNLTKDNQNILKEIAFEIFNYFSKNNQNSENIVNYNNKNQSSFLKGVVSNVTKQIHLNGNLDNNLSNNLANNGSDTNVVVINLHHVINNTEDIDNTNVKFRDELFRQIDQGILKNLGQGKRELTIKLFPPELGAIKLTIEVHNKDVSLTIHTDNSQVSKALNQHISNFERSLDQQGLKVVKIEIREDLSFESWTHNGDFREQQYKNSKNAQGNKKINLVKLIGESDLESLDANIKSRLSNSALYIIA